MSNIFELYLKESDLADITKKSYMYDYNNFVEMFEKAKSKGLENFNEDDVIEIINSMPTSSRTVKYKMFKMIEQFEEWALQRGFNHSYNPCTNIDFNKVVEINKSILESKYIDLEEAYKVCEKAKTKGVDYQDIVAFMLCRYGLKGKEWIEVRFLRWEDVDFENKVINVTNRDDDEFDESNLKIIKRIKIDDRMINYLYAAKEETTYEKDTRALNKDTFREFKYMDFGYVCKVTENTNEVAITFTVLRNRIVNLYKAVGMNRISMKDLVKSKKIDDLNDILKYKRIEFKEEFEKDNTRQDLNTLTNYDFMIVQEYYEVDSSQSAYFSLKKDYELLFGKDQVLNGKPLRKFMTPEETRELDLRIIEGKI